MQKEELTLNQGVQLFSLLERLYSTNQQCSLGCSALEILNAFRDSLKGSEKQNFIEFMDSDRRKKTIKMFEIFCDQSRLDAAIPSKNGMQNKTCKI